MSVLSLLEPELLSLEPELLSLEPELLSLELDSVPSGPEVLSVVEAGPEVLSVTEVVGSLVGSGPGPVVPVAGSMLVAPPVELEEGSVSVDGASHSPMHTFSGSPHARPRSERRSTGPTAATALRFICTKPRPNAR